MSRSNVISCVKELPWLIRKELTSVSKDLEKWSGHLVDGRGKAIRPTMVLLMGGACNFTASKRSFINESQHKIAMVAEMIHTASLLHDDIIDGASVRRGKPTVNKLWGEQKAVRTGNFILAQASTLLASLNNPYVIDLLTNVIEDLVKGEIMQLGGVAEDGSLFERYLEKTFKKTASLMAYSCKAVAVLSDSKDGNILQSAYGYGKRVGMAFQILDDVLDFRSSQSTIGKPAHVDLTLGLATAPVLFAAEKYPEICDRIMRNFSEPGDIQSTIKAVNSCDALTRSHQLAIEYSSEAIECIKIMRDCREKDALIELAHSVTNREK